MDLLFNTYYSFDAPLVQWMPLAVWHKGTVLHSLTAYCVTVTEMFGDHGYEVDNPSMEPIFVAVGPSFRQKFIAEDFSNIDVYPLVCIMLGLPPGPNNGSLDNIQTILAHPISSLLIEPLLIAVG